MKDIVITLHDFTSNKDVGDDGWVFLYALKNNMGSIGRDIADQIEAQTKPARIEEPGLWGVVKAGCGTYLPGSGITYNWVKHDRYWMSKSFPQLTVHWADLIDPTLIREGVTS